MKVMSNGDIYLEPGESVPAFKAYQVDSNDPLHYTPKFKDCRFNVFAGRMSACGMRPIWLWRCSKFGKQATVDDCEACNVSEPREGTAEKPINLTVKFTCKLH